MKSLALRVADFRRKKFCWFSLADQSPIGRQYDEYRRAVLDPDMTEIWHYVHGSPTTEWLDMCREDARA